MFESLFNYLELFQKIPSQDKEIICQNLACRKVKEGEILLQEGKLAKEMFFISKGVLKIVSISETNPSNQTPQEIKHSIETLQVINKVFEAVEKEVQDQFSKQKESSMAEGTTTQLRKLQNRFQLEVDRASRYVKTFTSYEAINPNILNTAWEAIDMMDEDIFRFIVKEVRSIGEIDSFNQTPQEIQKSLDFLSKANGRMQKLEEKVLRLEEKAALERKDELGNKLQDEIKTAKNHLKNFQSYEENSKEIMDIVPNTIMNE